MFVVETVPKVREYESVKITPSKAPNKKSHSIFNRVIGGLKVLGGVLERSWARP